MTVGDTAAIATSSSIPFSSSFQDPHRLSMAGFCDRSSHILIYDLNNFCLLFLVKSFVIVVVVAGGGVGS